MTLGSTPLNVLIVDDHPATCAGIELAVKDANLGTTVCCDNTDAAERILDRGGIGAIVSEVLLRGVDVLSSIGRLKAKYPDVPIIVFSGHDNPTYIARALALGTADYLSKCDPVTELIQAVKVRTAENTEAVSKRFEEIRELTRLRVEEVLPGEFPLTDRETQVLRHLALGLANKEIAASLGISVETVKEHVQNTLRKIGANDRTDAAVRAVRAGLLG